MEIKEKVKEPPCKDCLCLPICRTKSYAQLHKACSLVKMYLYISNALSTSLVNRNSKFEDRIFALYEILKPIPWKIRVSDHLQTALPTPREWDKKTKKIYIRMQKIHIKGEMR